MPHYTKKNLPVHLIRRFLEPGPIVLVSSAYKGETNIMTMGWHMVMEFSPSRIGCFITSANHSHDMILKSGECVINIPETKIMQKVIDIGNCSGRDIDKFAAFHLTPEKSVRVKAPLISECFANFECKLEDRKMVNSYGLFIFEVVKAHAATHPKYPRTMHYRGDGVFMVSGRNVDRKDRFKKQNL